MPQIPALGSLRQEDHEFKTSQGYIAKPNWGGGKKRKRSQTRKLSSSQRGGKKGLEE
jgi:hypothetical protein